MTRHDADVGAVLEWLAENMPEAEALLTGFGCACYQFFYPCDPLVPLGDYYVIVESEAAATRLMLTFPDDVMIWAR